MNGGRPGLRLTLGTRILLGFITTAVASTVVTLLLQDTSLTADLREAARARLERADPGVQHFLGQVPLAVEAEFALLVLASQQGGQFLAGPAATAS